MPGLLRGMARTAVVAGTATAVSNRVSRRQADRWAAQDAQQYQQEAYAAPPPPPPAPAAPAGDDRIEKLKELGELKAQGVLSEEEFAAEKARILGS
jgi:putative oligomerization/nucleic acid binding protein